MSMNLIDDNRPFTFDRVVRIVVSLSILIILYMFVNSVSSALMPFLVAWMLAYMLNPIVDFFQFKLRLKNRIASIALVLILLVAVLVGTVCAVVPSLKNEVAYMVETLNHLLNGKKVIDVIPLDVQKTIIENFNFKEIVRELGMDKLSSISAVAVKMIGGVFKGSYSFVMAIVTFFATILYLVFILVDYDKIASGALGLIPQKYQNAVVLILDDLKFYMSRYFRGQALVAFSVGVLLSIGFSIINLPLAIPLGLFIGLLNMVPYLQIIGIVPMLILSLMKCVGTGEDFWVVFGLAIIVLCVVQIIQDTFLVPKVMGKITGLNPAIILLSLSIWGALLGVVGMIIALPMTTILLSYYKRFVIKNKEQINNLN